MGLMRTFVLGVSVLGIFLTAVAFWLDVPRFVIGLIQYGGQAVEGTLQVGDPMPEVVVYEVDGTTAVPLSSWVGDEPLVLIFGSFT